MTLQQSPMNREDHLAVGPEVEDFAIKLDDCLSGFPGIDSVRDRVIRLVNDLFDYAVLQLGPFESLNPEVRCHDSAATKKYDHWKQEAQTWDLLRRLLPIRYPSRSDDLLRLKEYSTLDQTNSEHHPIWREFLSADSSAVEGAAILHWTQQNYSDRGVYSQSLNTDQQPSDVRGNIHTKSAIKFRKRLINTECPDTSGGGVSGLSYIQNDDTPVITQLDPDAATRQQRQLQSTDDQSELQLSQSLFYRMRWEHDSSGIRDLCETHGEVWRVAAMVDFPPRRTQAVRNPHDPDVFECEMAPLVLWRRMCFHLCRHGGKNDFERAVYGILAGDIRSVEILCENWDDLVFTHFNGLLRSQFDDYLIRLNISELTATSRRMFPVPDTISPRDHADIIRAIESHPLAVLDSTAPLKALQASIISGELEYHFYRQGAVLALEANSDGPSQLMPQAGASLEDARRIKLIGLGDHDELRVIAHVFFITSILDRLHVSDLGVSLGEEALSSKQQTRENILVGYISFLRLARLEDIIPLYCSELSEPRVYEVLHTNLIHVTDTAARSRYLDLMRKASIDPLKFVIAQSGMTIDALPIPEEHRFDFDIIERGDRSLKFGQCVKTDFFGEDPENLDNADDVLIRVVEWHLLVDEAWPNLFSILTRLYTHFLLKGSLNAARSLAKRVPCIDLIRRRQTPNDDFDPLWHVNLEFWRHQSALCDVPDKTYISLADDAKTVREIESLIGALDSIETLAQLSLISRQDSSLRRPFWAQVGGEIKTVNQHMKPLYNHWLQNSTRSSKSLPTIRDIYLAEVVLAHINCLHFAGTCLSRDHLLECMELVTLVASDKSDVLVSFTRCNRLNELLEAFSSCSKALSVITNDMRPASVATKRTRILGWSLDLWSV